MKTFECERCGTSIPIVFYDNNEFICDFCRLNTEEDNGYINEEKE